MTFRACPEPRAPLRRRLAEMAAGLLASVMIVVPATAQVARDNQASALRSGIDDPSELRQTPDAGLSRNLRGNNPASSNVKTRGDSRTPDEPIDRTPDDLRGLPDQPGTPVTDGSTEASKDAKPTFDLFEEEGARPTAPNNTAAAPVEPSGRRAPSPPTGAPPRADIRRATPRPGDPIIGDEGAGPPPPALTVPVGPVREPRVDAVGGRLNLPITGLRPAVPVSGEDPFAPVGIRGGNFVLYSTLEQSVGASTNLSESPDGESGVFSDTILSGRLLSFWSRHELEMNGLAAYRRNFAGEVESEPRVALDGRFRLDVDRVTTATLRGAVEYRQEDPIDLGPLELASDRPDIFAYSAGAEIEREFGRTKLGLDTSVVRETKSRNGGSEVALLDENFITSTAAVRAGYELSPALEPFVAGSLGRRVFDQSVDLLGTERDSVIQSLRSGLTFDFGEKLTGEAAAGYAWNIPDADALETTGSPTIDARIAWSPRRGTDLVFTAVTSFDPESDSSGTSTLYEGAVALRHRATQRTDLNATLSTAYRDSDIESDNETSYAAEAGFTRWINRSLALTGSLRHERLDGEAPDSDYTANSVKVGIRIQR